MNIHPSLLEAAVAIQADVSLQVESAVLELLETKHLYQSVLVNHSVVKKHRMGNPRDQKFIDDRYADVADWAWYVEEISGRRVPSLASQVSDRTDITWEAPHIKTFCKTCKRLEPFNVGSTRNLLNEQYEYKGGVQTKAGKVEFYVLTYVCQSCKGAPEAFMIRRAHDRLTLVGRGPIEHVEVPKDIPSQVVKFYSGAVVAHQSGQSLSAIFMLRTLIEQWARLFAASQDKADVIMDEYMASLPLEFRGRFASLKELYGTLSAAIHSASVPDDLFDKSVEILGKHFRARDLFELPGPKVAT